MPLTDERDRTVDLADFRGRVVVLADFLTSCQDECPISTGAFLTLERDLRADGLGADVAVVEVTVDPKRDTPARLAAYEKYTGVDWTLLTGSAAEITMFWQHFGASYNDIADGPDDTTAVDWETGKRYTYDVDHSNNVYVFDAVGHERLLTEGLPSIGKTLPPKLASLLSPLGVKHLDDPGFGAWTEADLRSAIGSLLGRTVPGS
jgi:protein SCO1/2